MSLKVTEEENDIINMKREVTDSSLVPNEKIYSVFLVLVANDTGHVIGFEHVGDDILANLIKRWFALGYPIEKEEKLVNPVGWDSYAVQDKEFLLNMLSAFTSLGLEKSRQLFDLINSDFITINLIVVT